MNEKYNRIYLINKQYVEMRNICEYLSTKVKVKKSEYNVKLGSSFAEILFWLKENNFEDTTSDGLYYSYNSNTNKVSDKNEYKCMAHNNSTYVSICVGIVKKGDKYSDYCEMIFDENEKVYECRKYTTNKEYSKVDIEEIIIYVETNNETNK